MTQPYLASPARTRAVLEKHQIRAAKKFGQNFLIDGNVLSNIVEGSGVTEDDVVLEIGPGIGTLTQYLAQAAKKVVSVEIDRALFPVLADTLKDFPNAEVVEGDILKTDIGALRREFSPERKLKVVANLPYYITTPVIFKLLEAKEDIADITVMVQTEVADRMQEGPGSKDYGALSLAVQYHAKPEILLTVSPSCFMPAPKVGSSVIRLSLYEKPPVDAGDEKLLFDLIRASFQQRRKTLVNGLTHAPELRAYVAGGGKAAERREDAESGGGEAAGLTRERLEQMLTEMGLDTRIRGEMLSLEQFAELSRRVVDITSEK